MTSCVVGKGRCMFLLLINNTSKHLSLSLLLLLLKKYVCHSPSPWAETYITTSSGREVQNPRVIIYTAQQVMSTRQVYDPTSSKVFNL